MRRFPLPSPGIVLACLGLFLAGLPGCRTEQEPAASPPAAEPPRVAADPNKNEIPASELDAVLKAHYLGAGLIAQYEYPKAAAAFREVHERAPGWIPGFVNLAIALLNMTGEQAEAAKKAGGEAAPSSFDEARTLLSRVLEREPDNRHAHYCLGIILEQQGRLPEAHQHFRRVTELDPNDAGAWYYAAKTLTDADDPLRPATPALARTQVELLTKALDLNPYLTPAIYKLAFASRLAGDPQKQKELLDRWTAMNPDRPQQVPGPGDNQTDSYGESGRYAMVINPGPAAEQPSAPAVPPRFEPAQPLAVKLQPGDRWATADDFQGKHAVIGRIRARFGAALATLDVNSDGKLDLFLPSAIVGASGLRDVLLLNQGDGGFEDATAAYGLPLDQASLGVAAADFDADRRIDLLLTGVGRNRLFRNRDGTSFEDLTEALKPLGPPVISLMARWLDLDQDGDLDLFIVNYCAADDAEKAFQPNQPPPAGAVCWAYRNDGQPEPINGNPPPTWAPLATAWNPVSKQGLSIVLAPWESLGAHGGSSPHTGLASLDLDNDRDIDLVLTSDGSPPLAIVNDRLGVFHNQPLDDLKTVEPASGLLVTDLDQDGLPDVALPAAAKSLQALRNTTTRTLAEKTRLGFEPFPTNAQGWRTAIAADLDLDGLPDLVGLPASGSEKGSIAWARNEGKRLASAELPVALETPGVVGLALADVAGDPLPDLILAVNGKGPAVARNLGNGHNWLSLQLGGHWRVKPELMRTNSHALGTKLTVQGQGVHVVHDYTTPESGLAQSINPAVIGLGKQEVADLVHLQWPDGVLQSELNVVANDRKVIAENNRKTGSCPVLFTWNGERFVCLGDFLGGGGMGYLVAPGVYGQPDRDESVAIAPDQLQAVDGTFRISITEPMDEVAYLDYLQLDVVDRPPGVSVTPDERFAPEGPRPSGELIAWTKTIEPVRATDLADRDVTETLRHWDRRTVDSFRRLDGWVGYAEEHGIILDFGDRLAKLGSDEPLVLCLAGWVEYPYSQTNYAAATAGYTLKPPALERLRDDGTWEMLEASAGYPAGLPRMTTLDLTGRLSGPRCVLRLRTNMECYYDQSFLAIRDRKAEATLRVKSLPVARAVLGDRGYTREVSPDGRLPLIYDYDYVDPAPLARMSGKLTRYGDVAGLLQADDDRFCIVGPGDEARIEFNADGLPPLPKGWTRSFVLRSFGYCKDADPFTAGSDTVEPLPWRGMPAYPFAPGVERPNTPEHEAYLREYQTRPAGGNRPSPQRR